MTSGWNFTFFASILLQLISSFASSTLQPSPSLSCFPNKEEVAVKERLEDWLAIVFGESFPFEKDPWVEKRGESEEDDSQENEAEEGEEGEGDFKGDIFRLRSKTGFFELEQVFWHR